jgi:PAS domain S-box-containing protein
MPDSEKIRSKIEDGLPLTVLKKAVDASPVTIVVTDTDGNIVYTNPQFTKLTGYGLEEAIGLNPRILNSGHYKKTYYEHLWKTIKTERKEWHGLFHNRKKDGSLYWEEAWINPVLDDHGRPTYFVAVKEDITLRKELAETNRALMAQNARAVETARILQRQMITQDLPVIPGFDISALYLPSESMSGDLFIVRELGGKLAVILADCTGHGVEASMHANLLWRHIFRFEGMLHETAPRIGEFLASVNRKLCDERTDESGYPTLFVAVIDTKTRHMEYASAGAVSPICWSDRAVKPLATARGMLLGYDPDVKYEACAQNLVDGDTLLFTTDGILEERQHRGEAGILEDEAFYRGLAAEYPDRSFIENLEYLFTRSSGKEHLEPLHDDASMVLLKALGPNERKPIGERRTIFL